VNPRIWLGIIAVLVALLATGAVVMGGNKQAGEPLAIAPDGIGPLRMGRDFDDAVLSARRIAPETAFAGLGCNGLDEVRYSGELAELPVSVMGMARNGRIAEVELSLDAPLQASDEAACIALRDQFAAPFFDRFGTAQESWTDRKPVSHEHMMRVGPAILVARWFPTGRTCYVSALYGAPVSL
jgi:hypothetical protein